MNAHGTAVALSWHGHGKYATQLRLLYDTAMEPRGSSWHFLGAFMAPHGTTLNLMVPYGLFTALHGTSWQFRGRAMAVPSMPSPFVVFFLKAVIKLR